MNKFKNTLLVFILSISLNSTNTFAKKSKQKWFHNWKSVLKAASYNKKPIFVDVYADWCHYCHILKREIFPSAQIQKLFNQFNLVRIDADSRPAFTKQFPATGLPKLFFFDKKGNLLRQHDGFISVGDLKEKLLRTLKEKNLVKQLTKKNTVASHFRLATLYYHSHKNLKALLFFQKVVSNSPTTDSLHKSSLFNLAVLQTKQLRYLASIKNWSSYIKLSQENEEGFLQAKFYRGLAYFKIKNYDKAEKDIIYAKQNSEDYNIRNYAYRILEEIKNARK